jgi:tetratricopeptide (TPR) repeat protein
MQVIRAALALACAIVPAAALALDGSPAPADYRSMSEAELMRELEAFWTVPLGAGCKSQLALLAELDRRHPDPPQYRPGLLLFGAICAAMNEDGAKAKRLLGDLEQLVGSQKVAPMGLYVAALIQDGPEALKWLQVTVRDGQLVTMDSRQIQQTVGMIGRSSVRADLDALAFDLAAGGSFIHLDPHLQETLATSAVRHAALIGDMRRVPALLEFIRTPRNVVTMLVYRDFEPAWPAIERRAGSHLAVVTQDYVDWTSARLVDEPENPERLQDYASALNQAQRYEEVVSLALNWLDDPRRAGGLAEADGWALNSVASAYDELDRPNAADAVYDRLAAIPADSNPWVVNFLINRQGRLVEHGRWDDALPANDLARDVAGRFGTPYARASVAGDRVCLLRKLGRIEDSDGELEALLPRFEDSPSAVSSALMCAGREDEAATLVADLMRDPDENQLILSYVQLADPDDEPSAVPQLRDLIQARDDLRNEAFKWVRLLPDEFRPVRRPDGESSVEGGQPASR